MERIETPAGIVFSYDRYGNGPPLVLVHGGFSDHATNWQEVRSLLQERFTVYAVARRGRGETTATQGHSLLDEGNDVAAVIRAIAEPVFLLGHSYGAQVALAAAAIAPGRIGKLVLYEPPSPRLASAQTVARFEELAGSEDWDTLVETFLLDVIRVPPEEVAQIRASSFWTVWTADARATLGDMRALAAYVFEPARFRTLTMPVLLLVGSESPREIYVTDAIANVLTDARIVTLEGQAHEGMTMAPAQFVTTIARFLLE
jgi:pimeloyl-ACP methyl ester carboxylesterase